MTEHFYPKALAISLSLFTTGACASVSYCSNALFAADNIPGPAALEMIHRIFVHGSNTFPPSLITSSLTFLYIGYTSPEGLLNSRYTYAGLIHFLGAPFTGLVMLPSINHFFIDAAHVNGGDRRKGVEFLGGEDEAKRKLVKFGRLNMIRTGLFGIGAMLGLTAALLERR